MDIIKRLNDNELYIDAIDDAIAEIERLRKSNAKLVAACTSAHSWLDMYFPDCPAIAELDAALKEGNE